MVLPRHAGFHQGPYVPSICCKAPHIRRNPGSSQGLRPQQLYRVGQSGEQEGLLCPLHLGNTGQPIGVAGQFDGECNPRVGRQLVQALLPGACLCGIGAGQLQHHLSHAVVGRGTNQGFVGIQGDAQPRLVDQCGIGGDTTHGRAARWQCPGADLRRIEIQLHARSSLRKMSLMGKNWVCRGSSEPPSARAWAPTVPAMTVGGCKPSRL